VALDRRRDRFSHQRVTAWDRHRRKAFLPFQPEAHGGCPRSLLANWPGRGLLATMAYYCATGAVSTAFPAVTHIFRAGLWRSRPCHLLRSFCLLCAAFRLNAILGIEANMNAAFSFQISIGILAFGIWIAAGTIGGSSPLAWALMGFLPSWWVRSAFIKQFAISKSHSCVRSAAHPAAHRAV
jgi:hypothetical protein